MTLLTDDTARTLVADFLALEAKLLDERNFEAWFEMLHSEINYEVPIRWASRDAATETADGAYRIRDDINLIKIRIAKLRSGQAWAEVPPSRTTRVVGSVLTKRRVDEPGVFDVDSAMLLYRTRSNDGPGDVIAVRRTDVLVTTPDGLKLKSRRALIADTVLQTSNLAVFL